MPLSTATQQKFQLVCQKIQIETHDVKTFVFDYPQPQTASAFSYFAGQHINFTLTIAGKVQHCCYTLSSSPTEADYISITIKRVPGGTASNYFHDHFQVGQSIAVQNATGDFYLPNPIPQKTLLLSAGSGITPMLAMLRFIVANKSNNQNSNQVIFFHSAQGETDLIARNEITNLAKQHGRCKVIYTLTQIVEPHWQGLQGRINERMFKPIPFLNKYQVFVCGPKLFRRTAQQIFKTHGLERSHYHYESFGEHEYLRPEIATIEQKTKSSTVLTSTAPSTAGVSVQKSKKKISIYFSRWRKYYQGNQQDSLLEQGEAAGLILPYSCRGGCCGSCKAKLINGQVKQHSTNGLSASEQQQGYILLCSCNALTDVEVSHE